MLPGLMLPKGPGNIRQQQSLFKNTLNKEYENKLYLPPLTGANIQGYTTGYKKI